MLVIADLTGRAAQARILAAAEIDRATVEEELGPPSFVRMKVSSICRAGRCEPERLFG